MSEFPDHQLHIQSCCEVLWERHHGVDHSPLTVEGITLTRDGAGFILELPVHTGEPMRLNTGTIDTISRKEQIRLAGVLQALCREPSHTDLVYGLRHADDPKYRSTNT